MLPKDITKLAFQFKETNNIPFTIFIDKTYNKQLDDYMGGSEWRNSIPKYTTIVSGVDLPLKKGGLELLPDGSLKDPFGTIWEMFEGNVPHLIEPAIKDPVLTGFKWPDITEYIDSYIKPKWPHEIAASNDSFRMGRHVGGLFETAWAIRGYENFLMDMITEESFCHELLEKTADWLIESIDKLLEAPVSAIILTEDYADQRGMVFGLDRYRKFFVPQWKRIFDHIHKANVSIVLHVCGNAAPALPDLIDIGLDCLESLQPEATDVYKVKKEYGKDLVLWGGVGVQKLMPFGTADEVKAEVRSLKKNLGKGGGFILNTAKPIAYPVPLENAAAYF
ncbi:MAG: hypothetical protein KAH95_06370, partial [Spirochaetales bacterium]|nr:hypothetical protein [Spirochaetales bacterium]